MKTLKGFRLTGRAASPHFYHSSCNALDAYYIFERSTGKVHIHCITLILLRDYICVCIYIYIYIYIYICMIYLLKVTFLHDQR